MYPRILHIYGPLWINSYGLMIALGFISFVYLIHNNPIRKKIISSDHFFNLTFTGIISGIVGGRVFFVLTNLQDFYENWLDFFYPWVGGFGIMGTIIGVLLSSVIYLKVNKIKILPVIDLTSLYAPLFQSISRIGCFLAGCCHGLPASKSVKWSVMFSDPCGLAPLHTHLHPTQLYLSLSSLLIFIILYFSYKKFNCRLGQITFAYLIMEGISRFSLDFWRGDRDFVTSDFFLSYSQLTASAIFIFAIVGFVYVTKKNKPLEN